mmetsp:Transcript_25372/g.61379  ORF Transcript_25372/g.61379 Transcript_25372/m.61379 type:complete len:272 (+) Transcript_25372:403-1218(+)
MSRYGLQRSRFSLLLCGIVQANVGTLRNPPDLLPGRRRRLSNQPLREAVEKCLLLLGDPGRVLLHIRLPLLLTPGIFRLEFLLRHLHRQGKQLLLCDFVGATVGSHRCRLGSSQHSRRLSFIPPLQHVAFALESPKQHRGLLATQRRQRLQRADLSAILLGLPHQQRLGPLRRDQRPLGRRGLGGEGRCGPAAPHRHPLELAVDFLALLHDGGADGLAHVVQGGALDLGGGPFDWDSWERRHSRSSRLLHSDLLGVGGGQKAGGGEQTHDC